MDFSLNEDRRLMQESLSRFLTDQYDIDKRHGFAMSDDKFSREMWAQFADLGIIGALFRESAGGFGGEGPDLMVVFEVLGRHLVVEPFLPTLLAGTVLAEVGNHNTLIEGTIAGDTLLAFAHDEPQSHYEMSLVTSTAKKSGDVWKISGNKSVVLGGATATHYVVSARLDEDENSEKGIALFLVEKSAAVSVRGYATLDGYGAAELAFSNSPAILLSEDGFGLIEKAYAAGITAITAQSLGAMEVAKDMTVEYMKTRKQFGIPIGKFQALQHRMADILIELEQMRSAVINAAGHLGSERQTREREVSAAKYLAGKIGREVAEEAIQIHGGMGMTWEYAVGHYSKHIIMLDHVLGDTDHHLERYIALGQT